MQALSRSQTALSAVSIETLLYGASFIAAGILRLAQLDAIPLSPAEAGQALAVWEQTRPAPGATAVLSPAYHSLTLLVVQLLGFDDASVRLVPALFGAATPLLAWLARPALGRVAPLAAGLLLALSPVHTLISRTAGGDAIAVFAALLALGAGLQLRAGGDRRWLPIGLAAVALGLASSPLFLTVIASFGAGYLLLKALGPAGPQAAGREVGRFGRAELRPAMALAAAVFMALATAFLTAPAGLGAAVRLPMSWVIQFGVADSLAEWLASYFSMWRLETTLLFLGPLAVFWAIWVNQRRPVFLLFWMAAAFLLALLQPGNFGVLIAFLLPAYLLVGALIGQLFDAEIALRLGPAAALVAACLGIVLINLGQFVRLESAGDARAEGYGLLALVGLAAGLIMVLLLATWDSRLAAQAAAAGFVGVLAFLTWGSAWWLGHVAAGDPRSPLVSQATDDDLRQLAASLRELSWQNDNSPTGIEIAVSTQAPAVRWYLREFANARFGQALAAADAPLLIGGPNEAPVEPANYASSQFGYQTEASNYRTSSLENLAWWLLRR
ncbi:MAG: glycosyltransferase family 39 protein, partial [Candidatus Promineifilaceae bacterium]